MNRREFLRRAGLVAGGVAGGLAASGCSRSLGGIEAAGDAAPGERAAVIVSDPGDVVAASATGQWAIGHLRDALAARQIRVGVVPRIEDAPAGVPCVVAAGRSGAAGVRLARAAGVAVPDAPESLALASVNDGGRNVLLACGADPRGLAYALTDVADAVTLGDDPVAALTAARSTVEKPANAVRGIGRLFCSDVEDKPWYNDRGFWQRYLTMLAAQRFNRFHLALGLGYDFARGIRDSYFYFPYPFFLAVPEYRVRAVGLPDAERDNNLEMLCYIGDECARRGIDFQLGLWGHQYVFADSPDVNYPIEGVTRESHANYCRDALTMLLKACPNVAGVTFRIHGESGIAEGNYDFWKTVFDGVVRCGRKVPIEMHAKGSDQRIIDVALATGMPVTLAPKYWAEHTGLPYVQASIRALELPRPDRKDQGFFAQSSGSRSFLRYGYGDLLAEDRRFHVVHRMWPGTQRVLLWGDPVFASAYGRTSGFCGSDGAELFEPMSFKGRMGAGVPGGRQGYADESLKTADDWEKYRYYYVLWGRMLFNPETRPETWRRLLRHDYGPAAAPAVEAALASASRMLPMVTTAHSQSASYNAYWVELSWNMPIVDATRRHPFADTPSPKRFGTVSPLDPQLFTRIDDFADQLLKGEHTSKYTPAEVASWLDGLARKATEALAAATRSAGSDARSPAFRRMGLDVAIQTGMGMFFAQKMRAGVLWAIYERTGDPTASAEALKAYRAARQAWAEAAERASGAYAADISYGPSYFHHGHWKDRLPPMDQDIADMEQRAIEKRPVGAAPPIAGDRIAAAIAAVGSPEARPSAAVEHTPPPSFQRGRAVTLAVRLPDGKGVTPRVYYRRVNQAEAYVAEEMEGNGGNGEFRATIPAQYTHSPFPLEYYFELRDTAGKAWMFPGFNQDWSNPPYFVIRQSRSGAVVGPPR